jgi:uncharacterized membrane protein YdbT with pleckstrin-like domain
MRFCLKPVFVGWTTLLAQLPLQLFFTFWCGLFFGGIIAAVTGTFEGDFEPATFFTSAPIMICAAIGFLAVPLIAFAGKKVNYAKAEYRFFDDHLELEEGFFSINRKEVRFSDIKEITLHKGFLQRFNGLGTIYLATLATGSGPNAGFGALGFGLVSTSGVMVRDIADPDKAYERIRSLVRPGTP